MPKEDPFVNRAQLLKAIKKYPEIWDSNNKLHMCRSVTAPMWNEIAEQFGGHVPTVKLQSIWSQMKYHYHNLVHRQILHKERFTTKWEHFEPMSFMYNITVAKIVGTANNETNSSPPSSNQLLPNSSASSSPLSPPPPVIPLPQLSQGRGRPSGSFTWFPLPTVPTPPPLSPLPLPLLHHQPLAVPQPPPPSGAATDIPLETPSFTGFTGLVPPAAITVETTTTPMRKPGRPGSMNNSMRGRIIDVIKAHPILWAGRQREQRQGQNRTSAVWKEVAAELGLTPSLVQTRWSIIKQRYVDELQKERHAHYSQQPFHSNWEHFDRMEFMREILIKKVDEREQTREQIQEIVSEQHQLQSQQQHQQQQQQQQQEQQQQQLQQQQQQQHLRYARSAPSLMGALPIPAHMATMGPFAAGHLAAACDDAALAVGAGVGVGAGAGAISGSVGGLVGMMPMHHHHHHHPHAHHHSHVGLGGRRGRVKTESDLEWDPFEMILHVHGTEPAAN